LEIKLKIKNLTPIITHLGAKDCVTGSCHLIRTHPDSSAFLNILVDCGKANGKPCGQMEIPVQLLTERDFMAHS